MQHLQPNTTLQGGKYRIERVLGQGGFGITYLATQLSLQRQVAIKEFFMKDFCSRDERTQTMSTPSTGSSRLVEQYRKKFIKEARNLARLNHPHIINVIDVFEENDTVYYVMPYLAGGSLQDYVKTHGVLSEQETMRYVKQIASALKYMHEKQHICHYDVKPANILLDDKGNAILIDFGISKNYDAGGQETTTTPIGMSDGYAPIEQYSNMAEFSPTSDVYALGATLYYLLHGKTPVKAMDRAGGVALLMRKQLSQDIKNIINASMKISKRERAQNMEVFLGDINNCSAIRRKCNSCGYFFSDTDKREYCPICHSTDIFNKYISSAPPEGDKQTIVINNSFSCYDEEIKKEVRTENETWSLSKKVVGGFTKILMFVFVGIVLPVIVYLGGGWIVKCIYRSIRPIESSMTLRDIYNQELWIYGIVAFSYLGIAELIRDSDNVYVYYGGIAALFCLGIFFCYILPMSDTTALLYSIIWICIMGGYGIKNLVD